MDSSLKAEHKKRSYVAPTSFKLQLIEEVKTHPIIWQNQKIVDKVQLDNAWKIVETKLKVKDDGFCQTLWAWLVQNYRTHLQRKTMSKMNSKISKSLAFLRSEYAHPSHTPFTAGRSPVPRTRPVAKQQLADSRTGVIENDTGNTSLAVLKYLMESVADENKAAIRDDIIRLLLKFQSGLKATIIQHGMQQCKANGSFQNIDWSTLEGQIEMDPNKLIVYKAVWEYEMRQMILSDYESSEDMVPAKKRKLSKFTSV